MKEYRVVKKGLLEPIWAIQEQVHPSGGWEFLWNYSITTQKKIMYGDGLDTVSEHPPVYYNTEEAAIAEFHKLVQAESDEHQERQWSVVYGDF